MDRLELKDDLVTWAIGTLRRRGFVVVPRRPTPRMVHEAWAAAMAENASGVWDEMIQAGAIRTVSETRQSTMAGSLASGIRKSDS
jgi:hypothetical protein